MARATQPTQSIIVEGQSFLGKRAIPEAQSFISPHPIRPELRAEYELSLSKRQVFTLQEGLRVPLSDVNKTLTKILNVAQLALNRVRPRFATEVCFVSPISTRRTRIESVVMQIHCASPVRSGEVSFLVSFFPHCRFCPHHL